MPASTKERDARIWGAPVLDVPYPTEVPAASGPQPTSPSSPSKSGPSPKLPSTTKTLLGGLEPEEEGQRPTTPNCPASIRFAASWGQRRAVLDVTGSAATRPQETLLGVGPTPCEQPATHTDDVAGAHVARPQATLLGVGPDRLLVPVLRGPVALPKPAAPSLRRTGDHPRSPEPNPAPSDLRVVIPLRSTWPALVLVVAGLLALALGVAYTF